MGGSANSLLWTQIKADITGKKIEVPASDTATTWGACMLAGVGVGLFPSYKEVIGRTIATRRRIWKRTRKGIRLTGHCTRT